MLLEVTSTERTTMDNVEDSSDCDSVFDVYDIRHVPSVLSSYDESINLDSEILNMTSLGAFMFLSQNESKTNFGIDTNPEDENALSRTRLSLAYERLHSMPKLLSQELSPHIKILDISNNEFENLNFLKDFKQLNSLICDRNNITSNTRIPHMPKLELLWLNHCKITELYPWAKQLEEACPGLKYLSLMGNPVAPSYLNGGNFYEYLEYRLFMISLFPNLVHLDDRAITADQRREAKKMYKRPMLDRLVSSSPTVFPSCFRSVSGKVSEFFSPTSNIFNPPQKNIII